MSGSPSVARLFARQLARVTDPATGAVDLEALRRLVCGSYEEAERDRRRIDRATQLMGEELEQANRALERLVEDLGLQSLRFEAALQNMPHGLIMYDAAERVVVVNSRLCTVVGLPDGTIRPGMTLRDVVALRWSQDHFTAVDLDALHAERRALLFGQVAREIEERIGDRTFVLASTPMSGGGCVILVQDITERRAAEARITHLAQHDALTGLPNRLQFRTRLQESLAMAHRGRPFALLCLDLDHFKGVNDTLGHPVGDKLLRDVTARLQGALRETDVVARLGGDEFAVIQNAAQQPEAAQVLAERIAALLGTPFDIDGHRIVIGTSIGIARGPEDGATPDLLLKSADLALYRAKALGRGTWSFFSAEMDVEMQERRRLEMDLRAALANHEFELAYQPLIDVDGLRLSGFEALLRWRSPTRGLVSPGDFVPLAEETGLILPIGAWVLHEATRTAAGWPSDLTVAVNVSAVQFRQPQLVDIVAGALAASGLAPERLELEVTETIMLHDNVQTIAQLHRLRRRGVRISMDDFGTGYSSLSYLRSFPFDKIKIDQSFIRDLETRAEAQAIVRAIAGLGFSLGMRTTAEGVESRDQLAELRAAGCTDAQGYLFGRPMPAAAVPAFLEGRTTQGVAGATAAGALTKRPA